MARVKLFLFSVTLMSFLRCITSDYVAAVVEYQSVVLPSPNDTVKANLEQYVFNIEQAKTSGAQIIVFPEYGLTGDIQNVSLYGIEIPNTGAGTNFTDEWLQKLSNAAVAHSIYIVVNLVEKSTNNANKTIYYNTDVVFDKNGKIAAKYRKINLFDEPNVTAGNANENQVTFTTDFGITFGIFTCYDLANPNPGRTILANSNVTDIVYPTAWSSFLPFYHSLSMQHGYAVANGVNLLAANLNKPEVGVGGSGIYNADGSVSNYYISGSPGTRLIIGNVKNTPVQRGLGGTLRGIDNLDNNDSDVQSPILNFNASRLFTADKYVFKTINISQSNITEEVCQNSFCCKFTIAVNSTQVNSTDIYKIMAFNGAVQVLSTQRKNQRICSLLACETDDIYTCGKHTVKLSSKFASIVVETSAAADKPVDYQPFSLTTNLVPVFNTTFNATVDNGVKKYSFYNQLEQENVVGFGFTGSESSAGVTGFSAFLLIGALFLNYAFF